MRKQLLIKNGKVVFSEGVVEVDLLTNEGVIEKIAKSIEVQPEYKLIDAHNKYVLPGIIDSHVHPQYVDGFESLSELAAHGGITTLIHYVYAKKDEHLIEKVEEAIEEGNGFSHLDFALHISLLNLS